MNGYFIVPSARNELLEIHESIAEHNLDAADRLLDLFYLKFESLVATPRIGPPRADLAPDVRILLCGSYVILYRILDDQIQILQIVHQSRDLPAVFRTPRN